MINGPGVNGIPRESVNGTGHTVAVLAYNKHDITGACLERVRASGFSGPLVLIDNGSNPPLAAMAAKYDCSVVRNAKNRFVNPVWNDLIRDCPTRHLTLLNNDCLVRDRYLDEVVRIMDEHDLALATPMLDRVESLVGFAGETAAQEERPIVDVHALRRGHLMTIDLSVYRLCYSRIPGRYQIYFGDDWIWGQLREHGYRCGSILNRTCVGETMSTVRANPEFRPIAVREHQASQRSRRMMQMRLLAGAIRQSKFDWWYDTHTIPGFIRRARRVLKRYLRRKG